MKKVFLLLTLIAATFSTWGATTITRTVDQLKSDYGWSNNKSYYQPFQLVKGNDIITISSVDGTAKFLDGDNVDEMRYYKNTEKGYGSIIIKAKAGYVITSVKLKYSQTTTNAVPCVFWAAHHDNFRVPTSDVLTSNVERSCYSNQVVIYTGGTTATSEASESQIRVQQYTVTYEQATLGRMFTKSFMDLVSQYNWESGKCPIGLLPDQTLQLNDALSIQAPNTGNMKYWVNNRALTCYKRSGVITFKAREGATIKNIRILYNQISETNSLGVLIRPEDWGTDGNDIPAAKQIPSNTWIPVNSNSVSFRAGNTKNNGTNQSQITITGFQIEYTDGNSQMETYTNLTDVSSTSEKKYMGDNGYKWKVKNFAHRDTCAMYDYLGIRLNYNGYIATDGNIEGGIKNASFEWRMSLDGNITSSTPVNFSVKAGSITDNVTAAPASKSAGHYMTYNHAFAVKSNCDFSINLGAKASTAQARPIIGPVTITPYLLYTKKAETIQAKDYESSGFKYTNTALINNTEGTGAITYAIENAADKASVATIDDPTKGEVTIKGEGTVKVIASWEGVTTTYDLTIQLKDAEVQFDGENPTVFAATKTITKTADKSTTANLIYSIDGNPVGAEIDPETGKVDFSKPGEFTIRATAPLTLPYKAGEATYKLTVKSDPIKDMKTVSGTVAQLKEEHNEWQSGYDDGYTDIELDDAITLNYGKYYFDNNVHLFRYYYQNNTQASKFTIQAKAGVIIKSVKFTYSAGSNSVLTDVFSYNQNAPAGHIVESGVPFAVDANSITFYNSIKDKSSGGGSINVTEYVITYFDPSHGVAITKSSADFGKQYGLTNMQYSQDLAVNHAITLHADANNTMRYWSDNTGTTINCYRDCGPIDIIAREGAKIHHVKISYYSKTGESILTKYWGTDGKNIPEYDRIASDSILYVNANSLRLWVGNKATTNETLSITKIYVNYSDSSEVVVDNFDNCGPTYGGSTPVEVAGVDGKYQWSITNFTRGTTDRMYYDQSIKLNNGGKISTTYTGGLKEAAFCWHPTTNARVIFTVKVGNETFKVDSAAKGGVYTFNFQKTAIKSNGEFSITVDNTSGTGLEFGHISLTPYLLYTTTSVNIAAKDYKNTGYKYKNNDLVINTTSTVNYEVSGDNAANIASVDGNGEVTIKGEGTVTVTASADGASTSYELSISLENANVAFEESKPTIFLSEGTYTQTAGKSTKANLTYEFVGSHTGAEIESSTGKVTLSSAGTYTIKATAAKELPYKAGEATYTLTVKSDLHATNKTVGQIKGTADWGNGSQQPKTPIADAITLSDGKYYGNSQGGEFRYYYGNNNAGKFTIQGKPGVIIQTIKLTYSGDKNTTLADAYYSSNITDANKKINSGTTYKIDANAVTYYVGKTGTNSDNNYRINVQSYEIKYFDPTSGVAVTKWSGDIGKQQLTHNTTYKTIQINNEIKLYTPQDKGTMRYWYTEGNDDNTTINCYNSNGPVDIIAREGATIHYVKITYKSGDNSGDAVITKNTGGGKSLQPSQYIASDSILFVNANSLKLYIGSKNASSYKTLCIQKIYVNYTDTTSVTESFETTPTDWTLTNCTTGDERVYYDQAVKLNTTTGKVSTTVAEGGIKDLSFDWSPVSTGKNVAFKVNLNGSAVYDLSPTSYDKNYVFTYTNTTGVKSSNIPFSIEMKSTSATELEISRIAITPYLLYTTKEANIALGSSYLNTSLIDNRDNSDPIVYTVEDGLGEFAADGTFTPIVPGTMTIKATWGGMTTSYTLHVSGKLLLDEEQDNKAKIVACNTKTYDVTLKRKLSAGKYNTFCVPFTICKDTLAKVLKTEITQLITLDESQPGALEVEGGQMNLNIAMKEVDTIKAGKPYLLEIAGDVNDPIEISKVTIVHETDTTFQSKDGYVTFYGITSPYDVPNDNHYLFMSNNRLSWNNSGAKALMKGLRSYFHATNGGSGVAARLVFNQSHTPTEVDNVNANVNVNSKMIINNQLIIIRDGKMYNAQGAIIK